MPLSAIIVEDEPMSRHYISALLNNVPCVDVVATASTEQEAINTILKWRPHIVFLDLELHTGTGFDVLKKIDVSDLTVVFTTALDHYALNLIKLSGMLFLQKPLDADELEKMVKKIASEPDPVVFHKALGYLLETLHNSNQPLHMAVQVDDAIQYIRLDEITRVETTGENTTIFFTSGKTLESKTTLKEIEDLLSNYKFFRISALNVVNLTQVVARDFTGNVLKLKNGEHIEVSKKKSEALYAQLPDLSTF